MEKLQNLRVLIVDDNEMARDILKEQLSTFGINVFTVNSGRAAILEIKQESINKPYDLVLLDWRMPQMDGIETAKILLNDKNIRQTFMTSWLQHLEERMLCKKQKKLV